MSQRLTERFAAERQAGRHLFVPFITAGDRGLPFTKKAILALANSGADAIELGVPFSDPVADGSVIQRSSQRALERGTTLEGIINLVKEVRQTSQVPIVLMGYLNPFLQPTLKKNIEAAAKAGVDGFVIPDLPPDEAKELLAYCKRLELDCIFLAAPTSNSNRLAAVGHASSGYIYYVSVAGTTGARKTLPTDIKKGVERVRKVSDLPVLVGFGISKPEQAKAMTGFADGVIVGSALVQVLENGKNEQDALKKLTKLSKSMVKAVKK